MSKKNGTRDQRENEPSPSHFQTRSEAWWMWQVVFSRMFTVFPTPSMLSEPWHSIKRECLCELLWLPLLLEYGRSDLCDLRLGQKRQYSFHMALSQGTLIDGTQTPRCETQTTWKGPCGEEPRPESSALAEQPGDSQLQSANHMSAPSWKQILQSLIKPSQVTPHEPEIRLPHWAQSKLQIQEQ